MPFKTLELFLKENDLEILDYNFSHLNILLALPFHHSDPFDRLIISQAISENLTIITNDRSFQDYQVKLLYKKTLVPERDNKVAWHLKSSTMPRIGEFAENHGRS